MDQQPSTIAFEMPTWLGGVKTYAGKAVGTISNLFYTNIVDPVEKDTDYFTAQASGYVERATGEATAGFWNAISNTLTWKNNVVGSAGDAVVATVGGLSSGLKWGAAIVVIGIALYAFLMISPFIPKPRN